MEADLLDNYKTIKILLATLGFPIFEEIKKTTIKTKEVFYCKAKEAYAEGNLLADGFVVFKGSKASKETTKNAMPWVVEMRNKLIDSKILKEENSIMTFAEDYIFNSPGAAASIVLGRHSNDWIEWKNKGNNKTLDELYRKE